MSTNSKKWNELDFYKEGQNIYGRDEEIAVISKGVINNVQTVVYGQSGVGKSSLLNAGIYPILRKNYFFPVFVRLGTVDPSSYIQIVKDRILEEAESEYPEFGKQKLNVRMLVENSQDDIWGFLHTIEFTDNDGYSYIPVLVFDQFEEILNDKKKNEYALQLLLDLYSLLDDTKIIPEEYIQYTNYRLLFSIREDYLYCLEEIIDKYNLSELRYNRHRVKWLTKNNATKVIVKTFGKCLEAESKDEICNKIIEKTTTESGDISTIYLSLYCSLLDMQTNGGVIKPECLNKIDNYTYSYYKNKMDKYVSYNAKEYLEKQLVTPDGRRNSLDYEDAVRSGFVTKEELNVLIENRLLRLVSVTGNNRIEFIHDMIPKLIVSNNHNWVYYLKKAFKERFNMAGTSSVEECRVVYIICASVMLLLGAMGGFVLGIMQRSGNPHVVEFNACSLLFFVLFCWVVTVKILIPTSVRRAHDAGVSGFKSMTINVLLKESSVVPYTPKTSYYYAMSQKISDVIFPMKSNVNSSAAKVSINKYEYVASFIRFIERMSLAGILFNIYYFISEIYRENAYLLDATIFIVSIFVVMCAFFILRIHYFKRLNFMGISPYLGIIPIYNIYLFFRCFKNDETDEASDSSTTKIIHVIIPSIMVCPVLYLCLQYLLLNVFN